MGFFYFYVLSLGVDMNHAAFARWLNRSHGVEKYLKREFYAQISVHQVFGTVKWASNTQLPQPGHALPQESNDHLIDTVNALLYLRGDQPMKQWASDLTYSHLASSIQHIGVDNLCNMEFIHSQNQKLQKFSKT
ncbi:hypothetical protein EPI10_032479 [Gossypium australe]|uniref:Uncharacterized protein n=1 Tax=Gossypium australe TaxID=47621 RepID=A0A5B6X3G2_9ROSI|nr:hypothetical protein EPI10_032479 [Gossypium australe]